MPAHSLQEEVLHGLPAQGQHVQGGLHSGAAQGPGAPIWLQLQGSPHALPLGGVQPLQAQAQAYSWHAMQPTGPAHGWVLPLQAQACLPDMLEADNKGTPCTTNKGPGTCSGSSLHGTGSTHVGSPDKEGSGIRLQSGCSMG